MPTSFVRVLPETSQIASGIAKALLAADKTVTDAAKRWKREIEAQLKDVKISVSVDTTKAKADIDKAAKDTKTTIQADADTAKAEAQIDAAARDRKVKLKVETDKASLAKAKSEVKSAAGDLKGSATRVAKVFGVTQAAGLAPNVVPLIGSVVQATGQLSGVLGLLPATAGAAGLAIGTLKIATLGFGDATQGNGRPEEIRRRAGPAGAQCARCCARDPGFESTDHPTEDDAAGCLLHRVR